MEENISLQEIKKRSEKAQKIAAQQLSNMTDADKRRLSLAADNMQKKVASSQ